jgi:hypothetical protein
MIERIKIHYPSFDKRFISTIVILNIANLKRFISTTIVILNKTIRDGRMQVFKSLEQIEEN